MEEKKFEECFIPDKDEKLKKLGLEICAQTFSQDGRIFNRMVFKRGGKETDVECIHTSICKIVKNPETDTGFEIISKSKDIDRDIELRQDIDLSVIPIEDHFFALKSYIQALVENGIQNTIINSLERKEETGQDPLDMNQLMRNQIAKALIEIAPEETKDLTLSVIKYISAGDPHRFAVFTSDFSDVICDFFDEDGIKKLSEIDGGFKFLSPRIQRCIGENNNLSEKYIRELFDLDEPYIQMGIAKNINTPRNLLNQLASNRSWEVREHLAERDDLSDNILKILVKDDVPSVRNIIKYAYGTYPTKYLINLLKDDMSNWRVRDVLAFRADIPMDLIMKFARDQHYLVKQEITMNDRLPEDEVRRLSKDPNWMVRLAVTRRDKIPRDVIKRLVNDPNDQVKTYTYDYIIKNARKIPKIDEILAEITDGDVIQAVKDVLGGKDTSGVLIWTKEIKKLKSLTGADTKESKKILKVLFPDTYKTFYGDDE